MDSVDVVNVIAVLLDVAVRIVPLRFNAAKRRSEADRESREWCLSPLQKVPESNRSGERELEINFEQWGAISLKKMDQTSPLATLESICLTWE